MDEAEPVLHQPAWHAQIERGTLSRTIRRPRTAGVDQRAVAGVKNGHRAILRITPYALKLGDDDRIPVHGVRTEHRKLCKRNRAGRKPAQFQASYVAPLN